MHPPSTPPPSSQDALPFEPANRAERRSRSRADRRTAAVKRAAELRRDGWMPLPEDWLHRSTWFPSDYLRHVVTLTPTRELVERPWVPCWCLGLASALLGLGGIAVEHSPAIFRWCDRDRELLSAVVSTARLSGSEGVLAVLRTRMGLPV